MRLPVEVEDNEDGWTRWIYPLAAYRVACCDCGLVHDIQIKIVKVDRHLEDGTFHVGAEIVPAKARVAFRARRNRRSTAAVKRERAKRAKAKA